MPYDHFPPVKVVQLGTLYSSKSKCSIIEQKTDSESGDQITANCGSRSLQIASGFKGAVFENLSACQATLVVHAVRQPRLFRVSNCHGSPVATEFGAGWTRMLLRKYGIGLSQVEYTSYTPILRKPGCYQLRVTFDANRGATDTSFQEKSSNFCIQ